MKKMVFSKPNQGGSLPRSTSPRVHLPAQPDGKCCDVSATGKRRLQHQMGSSNGRNQLSNQSPDGTSDIGRQQADPSQTQELQRACDPSRPSYACSI